MARRVDSGPRDGGDPRLFVWLRRSWQVFFLLLFLFLVVVTTGRLIGGFPVQWFLGLDPLAAVATALGARTLTTHLMWAIPLIVLTLFVGRFFCGWVCPMGTLHHLVSWLARKRRIKTRVELSRPSPAQRVKYWILLVFLGLAAAGSVQVGLLDPIASLWRAVATVVVPAGDNAAFGLYQGERHFRGGVLILALFAGFLALNVARPRLFCRVLCPLGALLGALSRFSLFRLRRDDGACNGCNACASDCQGAADPQGTVRPSECMLCLNCTTSCPQGAVRFVFAPTAGPAAPTDLGRRRVVGATAAGFLAIPLVRASESGSDRPPPSRIRPPGALDEPDFLARCLKCGACMKVCPTNALQPALAEAGVEGLFSPLLVPRLGYCEQACVLCGHVCPTGALRPLTLVEKVGQPPDVPPTRMGTAFVDRSRCLPWASDTPCIVCEEVCPTSPKAIHVERTEARTRDGKLVTLQRPHVDLKRCTGCGICENRCPIYDKAGIRVTSVGETRSLQNRIML